jgi:hypothetical protein
MPLKQGSISGQPRPLAVLSTPRRRFLHTPGPIMLISCLISELPHRFPMRQSYPGRVDRFDYLFIIKFPMTMRSCHSYY